MLPDVCERCGKCCYYGKNYSKPCRNLIYIESGAFCKIYNHRLGAIMGKEHNITYYCGERGVSDTKRLIEGCPYNSQIA